VSHPLLTAPIGRSLWRLAAPTTALIVVQIVAGVGETWIVARLGTDSLAGYVLVLPFAALMTNMANGGIGGAVASALARALGGGRHDDARALLLHALVVALALALLFTVVAWTVLPSLYALMGGSG
jgi:MATE family, multidrug efflux pump